MDNAPNALDSDSISMEEAKTEKESSSHTGFAVKAVVGLSFLFVIGSVGYIIYGNISAANAVKARELEAANQQMKNANIAAQNMANAQQQAKAAPNPEELRTLENKNKASIGYTGYYAQLGSYLTQKEADEALQKYREKGLSGPAKVYSANLGGKGMRYRIIATGFEDAAQVHHFCEKSHKIKVNCMEALNRPIEIEPQEVASAKGAVVNAANVSVNAAPANNAVAMPAHSNP